MLVDAPIDYRCDASGAIWDSRGVTELSDGLFMEQRAAGSSSALASCIYSGTSEIQKMIISAYLGL